MFVVLLVMAPPSQELEPPINPAALEAAFALTDAIERETSLRLTSAAAFDQLPLDMPLRYIRVSTTGQGRSGLGLEAQREAIARFARDQNYAIAAEYHNSTSPC